MTSGGSWWLLVALGSSWWLLVAHLVIPDNPEGYMTKKASISNIAGESIPLMFGVLPRDNVVFFPKHRGSDMGF